LSLSLSFANNNSSASTKYEVRKVTLRMRSSFKRVERKSEKRKEKRVRLIIQSFNHSIARSFDRSILRERERKRERERRSEKKQASSQASNMRGLNGAVVALMLVLQLADSSSFVTLPLRKSSATALPVSNSIKQSSSTRSPRHMLFMISNSTDSSTLNEKSSHHIVLADSSSKRSEEETSFRKSKLVTAFAKNHVLGEYGYHHHPVGYIGMLPFLDVDRRPARASGTINRQALLPPAPYHHHPVGYIEMLPFLDVDRRPAGASGTINLQALLPPAPYRVEEEVQARKKAQKHSAAEMNNHVGANGNYITILPFLDVDRRPPPLTGAGVNRHRALPPFRPRTEEEEATMMNHVDRRPAMASFDGVNRPGALVAFSTAEEEEELGSDDEEEKLQVMKRQGAIDKISELFLSLAWIFSTPQ
jgi:hypothetical protein